MSNAYRSNLIVQERAISSLKPHAHNARTHSKKQLHQIAASIREFGFTNPVLIDQADTIIAGHGRVAAAGILGLDTVPTICIIEIDPIYVDVTIRRWQQLTAGSAIHQASGHAFSDMATGKSLRASSSDQQSFEGEVSL